MVGVLVCCGLSVLPLLFDVSAVVGELLGLFAEVCGLPMGSGLCVGPGDGVGVAAGEVVPPPEVIGSPAGLVVLPAPPPVVMVCVAKRKACDCTALAPATSVTL